MKYRVVIRDCQQYPYEIQLGREMKFLFFWRYFEWKNISIHASLEAAQHGIREHYQKFKNLAPLKPGEVVFEYSEDDVIIDKLKGTAA